MRMETSEYEYLGFIALGKYISFQLCDNLAGTLPYANRFTCWFIRQCGANQISILAQDLIQWVNAIHLYIIFCRLFFVSVNTDSSGPYCPEKKETNRWMTPTCIATQVGFPQNGKAPCQIWLGHLIQDYGFHFDHCH
jgi:hypothetical protein